MKAADILRERAHRWGSLDSVLISDTRPLSSQWRAVAELMEESYRRYTDGRSCRFCEAEYWNTAPGGVERTWKPHQADCPLAALERAITGESDAPDTGDAAVQQQQHRDAGAASNARW